MADRPDADQQATVLAVRQQASRCLDLVKALDAPGKALLARVGGGDPNWARMAKSGYNTACEDRYRRLKDPVGADAYADALAADPDLKQICDARWILGQEVDELRARLGRLDTIAAPVEAFERCIRSAITEPDRTPQELVDGVSTALAEGRSALAWNPKPPSDPKDTLFDRLMRTLKNNPLVAVALIAVAVLAGVLGVLKDLLEVIAKAAGHGAAG